MQVLDRDIRAALHAEFQRTYPKDTVVIDEFSFQGVCADLGVFFDEEIHLWEIKSDADNLRRLPMQVERYSLVGNACTIVAGPKHLLKVMDMVPPWWGIQCVEPHGPILKFTIIREAGMNPAISTRHVSELFWKPEVWSIWQELGETKGKSRMTKWALARALAQRLDNDEILKRVCKAVRTRRYHMHRRPPKVISA